MFNQYPYLNIQDLNLDYIMKSIKDMRYEVTNFVSINAIKYADPIQWNITSQYEKNTIVIDPVTGTAYISVAPVPAGVALTRPEYWTVVFDLGSFVTRAAQNFTSRWESETTTTATFASNTGDWLVWGDVLYKALTNITAGDTYVVGSNIEHFTIEDLYISYLNTIASILAMVGDLADLTTSDTSSIVNAINSVITVIGDLDNLASADKTSIVNAINSVIVSYATGDNIIKDNIIGALSNLKTTDKSLIVNAINEIVDRINMSSDTYVTPQMYGAVGDGVTDDTTAVQAALDSGKNVRFISNYAVTSVIYSGSFHHVDFNGYQLMGIGTANDFIFEIYAAMYNYFTKIDLRAANGCQQYYIGGLRMHSRSDRQCQYNVIEGLYITECWQGFVWGAPLGGTSVWQAQSETYVIGFRVRSCRRPFIGNQDNGFITFIGGTFDCNVYETWTDGRFNNDDNTAVYNSVGQVILTGCEVVATNNINHVGFYGKYIFAYDTVLEVAGTQGQLFGDFILSGFTSGYISSITKTPFIIENYVEGTAIIERGRFHHEGNLSSIPFIYGYLARNYRIYMNDIILDDIAYNDDLFGNVNTYCKNVYLHYDNIMFDTSNDLTGLSLIDDNFNNTTCVDNPENLTLGIWDILDVKGIGIRFNSGNAWDSVWTEYIPIFGGVIAYANALIKTEIHGYFFVEFYDSALAFINSALICEVNPDALNRCKLFRTPNNAKYCRIRFTNGTYTGAQDMIAGRVRLSTLPRTSLPLELLNVTIDNKIGDLNDLTTTDKDSIVDAINELNTP